MCSNLALLIVVLQITLLQRLCVAFVPIASPCSLGQTTPSSSTLSSSWTSADSKFNNNNDDRLDVVGTLARRSARAQGLGPIMAVKVEKLEDRDPSLTFDVADFFVGSFWAEVNMSGQQRNRLAAEQAKDLRTRYGPTVGGKRQPPSVFLVALESGSGEYLGTASVEATLCDRVKTGLEGTAKVRPLMSNLAVAKKARRRGLAKKLVRACEKEVKDWGFSELTLLVNEQNARAISLYKKLGYKVIAKNTNASTVFISPMTIKAVPCTTLFMVKDLNAYDPFAAFQSLFGL